MTDVKTKQAHVVLATYIFFLNCLLLACFLVTKLDLELFGVCKLTVMTY